MKIKFKVHGVNPSVTTAKAVIEGEEVMATVRCLEVELVSEAERHGNITLRFTGTAIPEAQALFVKDGELTATFED